ncbi:MAG: hypothetical protein QOE11_749 [Solirubrobacteraceae bacterium]|jgi:hypothetical protein|nr:hypothetical protein [Solirubrobacteraceae bacterium]
MCPQVDTHPHVTPVTQPATATAKQAVAAPPCVPLLLLIGPPSVGKSSVARHVCGLLEAARIGFAFIDRDDFGDNGLLHDDPLIDLNEMLHARVAVGAERLVVAWRVQSGLELDRVRAALGWTDITVCRLHADTEELLARIGGDDESFQLLHLQSLALEVAPRLARQAREDILLSTSRANPKAVAMRAFRQWAMRGAPPARGNAPL